MSNAAAMRETRTRPLTFRWLTLTYGTIVYLFFFTTFLYFIGFVAGIPPLPKTVDTGAGALLAWPLGTNLGLVALFGLQHSVMARQCFKRVWTRVVPPPVERSTYVLLATAVLGLLMWLWQPMPAVLWHVDNAAAGGALWIACGIGWTILLASTFMTDHFDLFGLRQTALYAAGKPYTPVEFQRRWLYRYVRHPLYTGFFIALWTTPTMTLGHAVLAAGLSVYIVAGTLLEERDMLAAFGQRYRAYCRQIPRYFPRVRPRDSTERGTRGI